MPVRENSQGPSNAAAARIRILELLFLVITEHGHKRVVHEAANFQGEVCQSFGNRPGLDPRRPRPFLPALAFFTLETSDLAGTLIGGSIGQLLANRQGLTFHPFTLPDYLNAAQPFLAVRGLQDLQSIPLGQAL